MPLQAGRCKILYFAQKQYVMLQAASCVVLATTATQDMAQQDTSIYHKDQGVKFHVFL